MQYGLSKVWNIRKYARNWYKRCKSEGHYLAKKVGGKNGRVTPQDIASYIETNPNFILSDMGKNTTIELILLQVMLITNQ